MSGDVHTIPDHIAARAARLINEADDMRKAGADALKDIYADMRDELRGMGWAGPAITAEVAAFKGAIAEMRLDEDSKTKRDDKSERVGDYVSMLSRARAREANEQAAAKSAATNEPTAATDTVGEYLREPAAVVSGQIIREGDAPRETDCQAGEISQGGSDASCLDTEFSSAALTPEQLSATEVAPPSALGATNFSNPRCQHPDTCHFAGTRESCHECLMAWSLRPRDEQVRLWAEANEAARAAA